MGFRIRKSIKVAPGVRLNFGKKGISTSIGKRGAGITIGPTGTTAHVGIPGTGISYVKKVGTTKKSVEEKSQSTGENKKPKRNYSCLGSFLAFSGIVIVMAIHSTCEWTALTLAILIICVLYISFAIITYLGNILKKNIMTDTNYTKDVSQTMESTSTPINPKEPFTRYKYPSLSLLKKYEENYTCINEEEQRTNMNRIIEVLGNLCIQIKTIHVSVGPAITLYEMQLADGMLLSKVKEFEDDIALSLSAFGTRVIAPLPGKETFGIEIPNSHPKVVGIESILSSSKFQESQMELPLALGKTINNEVFIVDLAVMPHLLISGSVDHASLLALDTILFSLFYKKHPNELKLVLIDLNRIELNAYKDVASIFNVPLIGKEPIATETKDAIQRLKNILELINDRYKLLEKAGVDNIKEYNYEYIIHRQKLAEGDVYMPYFVVVINELGNLIMEYGKEAEDLIVDIAKKANNVGVHMVITTGRPSEYIVTKAINNNIPGRIAFKMSLRHDSQIILGYPDANSLIGQGDMLYLNGNELVRLQCPLVGSSETERVNDFFSKQAGIIDPTELPEPLGVEYKLYKNCIGPDLYLEDAARAIVSWQQGSTSMIQRRFSIGYLRAYRLMEQLEAIGVVGSAQGNMPRKVLVNSIDELELKLALYVKRTSCSNQQAAPNESEQVLIQEPSKYDKKALKDEIGDTSQEKDKEPVPNPLDALMNLIGLSSVKEEIISLVNFIKLNKKRAAQGLPVTQIAYHCVFTGNPGTGKTTVARLLAGIFKELGVLQKGQLIETDRSGLVAEYIGQTAVKTNKIIDSALDGVLFIDEAYTLAQGGSQDYGHEAIATLLKRMEDDRDRLIVILAGYGSEMKTFIDSNPGLRSRFNRYINFPDYTSKELLAIFQQYLKKQQYMLSESALRQTINFLTQEVAKGKSDFGNARFVRNLFEKAITQQANRLANIENCDKDLLKRIEEEDIIRSIERM